MNPTILTGVICVTTALILFTVLTIRTQKSKRINKCVLSGFALAVLLDLTALISMSIVAERPFNIHGAIGYSAFLIMAIGVVRLGIAVYKGSDQLPASLGLYMKYAYGYWLLAYITGVLMSAM